MENKGDDINQYWRADLRTYLAEHVNQPLVLGEVYDLFTPAVPLHHATRGWNSKHPNRNATVDEMREVTVRMWLASFPLKWKNVQVANGKKTPRCAIFIPFSRECPGCGRPYFSHTKSKYCTRSCGTLAGRAATKAADRRSRKPPEVQRILRKIDALIDELDGLKDQIHAIRWQSETTNDDYDASEIEQRTLNA
jgi:uncharacterized Zn finger protein (UPF0148 family)